MPLPYRAAVFDMDGTLVDNMSVHARAWLDIAAELGVGWLTAETIEREWAGQKNSEIFPKLLGRPLAADELARLSDEKERRYRALYAPSLRPVDGLEAFLDDLQRAGVALALATAAPPENRAFVLDGLGLTGRFARIIGAEHAPRGKPAPDIYLAAARALELPPEACLAFEDARNGVLSARAAGMACVGVTTVLSRDELLAAGAVHAVRDFVEARPLLAGLWAPHGLG
jgi:beta-phosphoglucomutase